MSRPQSDLFTPTAGGEIEADGKIYRPYSKGMEEGFSYVGDNHPWVKRYGKTRYPFIGSHFIEPGHWLVYDLRSFCRPVSGGGAFVGTVPYSVIDQVMQRGAA